MKAITRIFGLFVAGFAIQFILDAVLLITSIYLNTPGYLRSEKEFRKAVGRIKEIRGRKMRKRARRRPFTSTY